MHPAAPAWFPNRSDGGRPGTSYPLSLETRRSVRPRWTACLPTALRRRSYFCCNLIKDVIGERDLAKDRGNVTAGDACKIFFKRNHQNAAEIDRCRAHGQLARMKNMRAM